MSYIGDFPPCTHHYVNSNGIVICEWCGQPPKVKRTGLGIVNASNG